MTTTQSTTARAGSVLNKALPEAPHAYVDNGRLMVMDGGRYVECGRSAVFCMAQEQEPSSERRRQLLAVLAETHDDYFFRAPRYGDLVVCPYCDADAFTCDHCGGERRLYASEVFSGQCDSPQPPLIAGRGGKPRSPVSTPQSTTESPTPGSSRSASSPTGSGSRGRSSPPTSGGSRARSTPKPESFSPLKSCGPKSTDAAPTLGANGHG